MDFYLDIYEPLRWPIEWKNLTSTQKFLLGFPIFGFDYRIFRLFKKKISARDENIHKMWPNDTELSDIRDEVAKMLVKIYGWPNTLFHPEDPCSILFWKPNENLEFVEICLWLGDYYCIEIHDIINKIHNMSFYQLILKIRQMIKEDNVRNSVMNTCSCQQKSPGSQ